MTNSELEWSITQCVVTCGNQLMPQWCVDNWDILALVSSIYAMYCTLSCSGKLWRGLPNAFFADSSNIMLPRCTPLLVLVLYSSVVYVLSVFLTVIAAYYSVCHCVRIRGSLNQYTTARIPFLICQTSTRLSPSRWLSPTNLILTMTFNQGIASL